MAERESVFFHFSGHDRYCPLTVLVGWKNTTRLFIFRNEVVSQFVSPWQFQSANGRHGFDGNFEE